jgi:hypothetical protein
MRSPICNMNLACSKVKWLDCYDMIATTSDYDMTIITLGSL